MRIIKLLRDEYLRLYLLTFPFKFFGVETVDSSEGGYATGSGDTCSRDDENIFVLHHSFHNILDWLLDRQMVVFFPLDSPT